MLKRVSIFEIDTDIHRYNDYVLKPIDDSQSLQYLRSTFGINKMFKNEAFYHAVVLNEFCGRTADFNIVATICNRIYKLYFQFLDTERHSCTSFRNAIREHFAEYIPASVFRNPQITEVKHGRLSTWHFDWGNIIIEETGALTREGSAWNTAIAVTSNIVKNAEKIGVFDRFFK